MHNTSTFVRIADRELQELPHSLNGDVVDDGIVKQWITPLYAVTINIEHVVAQLAVSGACGLGRIGYLCLYLAKTCSKGEGRIEIPITAALLFHEVVTFIIVELHVFIAKPSPQHANLG